MTATASAARRPVLRADGLGKRAQGRWLLSGLDLELEQGSCTALVGVNGAGKSTFLDLVCGLTRPSAGTIRVAGLAPVQAVRQGLVGAMLQSGGLLGELTVARTISTIAALHAVDAPPLDALDPALAAIGGQQVRRCSGGERQRIRWALARLTDPLLMVLDEPTAGMDWRARQEFWDQVRVQRERGASILYTTHHADEVDEVADRVAVLHGGQLVAVRTPAELLALAGDGPGALFRGVGMLLAARPADHGEEP